MKYHMVKVRFLVVVCIVVFLSPFIISASAQEQNNDLVFGKSGEYGTIYGAEYDSENGNTSKWLTIKPGDNGVRIIGENNQDVLMVDKHGGVYINGTLYINGQQYISTPPGMFSPENGFLYFLIILSLGINVYLLYKTKK